MAAGLVALLGLVCVAYRSDEVAASAEPGNALAMQSLSSGFKVIAGWESQHHSYARAFPSLHAPPCLTFLDVVYFQRGITVRVAHVCCSLCISAAPHCNCEAALQRWCKH